LLKFWVLEVAARKIWQVISYHLALQAHKELDGTAE
jgi:hypothetical protein